MSNQDWNVPTGGVSAPQVPAPIPSKQSAPSAWDIAAALRSTTEAMAVNCSVDMALWNVHSNACLAAAAEVERLCEALLNIMAVQRWRDIPIDTVNCSHAVMDCREMYDIADGALSRAALARAQSEG